MMRIRGVQSLVRFGQKNLTKLEVVISEKFSPDQTENQFKNGSVWFYFDLFSLKTRKTDSSNKVTPGENYTNKKIKFAGNLVKHSKSSTQIKQAPSRYFL